MKYGIDIKYIALFILKVLAAYGVSLIIVLTFFNLSDPSGFVISSITAAIVILWVFLFPRPITVRDGNLDFRKKYSLEKISIPIDHIIRVEIESDWYNKVTITTAAGTKYELYPSDPRALKEMLGH